MHMRRERKRERGREKGGREGGRGGRYGYTQLTGSQRAYCRSLERENPVVKILLLVPQNTARDGLVPT